MGEDRLQLCDLVSWKPVQQLDYVCYGVIIRKEVPLVDSDRILYTVYTQRNECVSFFQHSAMEARMKVESR